MRKAAVLDRERLIYVPADKLLIRDGEEVWLTPNENEVLRFLCEHRGHFKSTGEIWRAVWSGTGHESDSLPRVYTRKLAIKLLGATAWIENQPWHGYRVAGEVEVVLPTKSMGGPGGPGGSGQRPGFY